MFQRRQFMQFATCFSVLAQAGTSFAQDGNDITVSINKPNNDDYLATLDGRDPAQVDDFSQLENLTRHTLEMILFAKAVKLGLPDKNLVIKSYAIETNFARTISNIRAGIELTHPVAGFDNDTRYDDDFRLSKTILSGEDFFVGLYTPKHRTDIIGLTREEDIKKLRFVCGRNWQVDQSIINTYGFDLQLADDWASLMQILLNDRADVILQPFRSSEDMGFKDGHTEEYFLPIKEVKLRFGAGRSYMVSTKHPFGQEMVEGINRGIDILDQDDFLRKSHIQAGVIDPRADNFKVLFPDVDLKSRSS